MHSFEKDELILQIKKEAQTLKSMVDKIEREFQIYGKRYYPDKPWYIREDGLFFDAKSYAAQVHSMLFSQMEKIIHLLKKRFPWAPISESILYSVLCKTVDYYKRLYGPSYVSFDKDYCCIAFKDLMDPHKQDEFLSELFKPVYVCAARLLWNTTDELDPSSSSLKDYDPIILNEALKLAEKEVWISRKENGKYIISEKPLLLINCPVCSEKVYAHEDYCPRCGFYIPNLALRSKIRLEIPKLWYQYDEQQKLWVAFFKFDKSQGEEERSLITIGTISGNEYKISVINICDKVLASLKEAQIIHHLPDEYYAIYYTSFLRFSRLPKDTYAIYAPSIEELEQILKDILNQLQREASREYDENIRLVDSPIPKEKFMEEFLENLNNYFIPPLNKHPVLTRKTIMRQEEGKGQPVYIEKKRNIQIDHCPRCGAPVEPGARFCWRCGAKLV
jgi:uncharacterized OB-fold protein